MLFILICFLTLCSVESRCVSTERKQMNDGNLIPYPIFGCYVYNLNDRLRVVQATIKAIEAGYRHIDTAYGYLTEDMVGEAIANVTRRGIVKRKDLFVCTKLSFQVVTRDDVIPAVIRSLKRMKLDYVDLYIIHTPRNVLNKKNHDDFEIWKGLEDAKLKGLVKSIGVSNYNSTDMARILADSNTVPAVNQIETNPTFANQELVAYCQSKDIIVTGYAPFGFLVPRPYNDLALPPAVDDPVLVRLARKYGVTVFQILLRYLIDRDILPIAASLDEEHIEENIDIFDFTISPEDILKINKFDRNVKVYLVDYEGLYLNMREGYLRVIRYVQRNNLRQYDDVV